MSEIILSKENIRKLLAAGNGDSALLYLCRAAGLSDVATGFTEARLECAATLLRQLGLDESGNPRFVAPADRPEYTEEDVTRQMDLPRSGFRKLVGEVQRCLGRVLSTEDLKILLGMSEYLGLSGEVINILVHFCVERARVRASGRLPSLRSIEKEAYRWADEGIDTVERAAAYMQNQNRRYTRQGELCELMGITDRRITPTEEKYLRSWVDMGFGNEVISLAYSKTCENTGGLNWKYMSRILESWNSQGLYTVEAINAGDRKTPAKAGRGGYQRHGEPISPMMQDAVRKMLEESED